MITYFDLNLDLFKAFLTLSDLVFPPFITSKSSKMLILVFFRLLITRVIFLNLSSLINSILCISKFLFFVYLFQFLRCPLLHQPNQNQLLYWGF